MVQRAHKKWVPSVKTGEVKHRQQFWNPYPERVNPHFPKQQSDEPYCHGDRRATDLDIAGKELSKRGPIDG